jgi:hypothetical protein
MLTRYLVSAAPLENGLQQNTGIRTAKVTKSEYRDIQFCCGHRGAGSRLVATKYVDCLVAYVRLLSTTFFHLSCKLFCSLHWQRNELRRKYYIEESRKFTLTGRPVTVFHKMF